MKIIDAMKQMGVKPVKLEGLDSHVPEGTIFDEYGNTYMFEDVIRVWDKVAGDAWLKGEKPEAAKPNRAKKKAAKK